LAWFAPPFSKALELASEAAVASKAAANPAAAAAEVAAANPAAAEAEVAANPAAMPEPAAARRISYAAAAAKSAVGSASALAFISASLRAYDYTYSAITLSRHVRSRVKVGTEGGAQGAYVQREPTHA